jgi:hypothetical protein
MVVNNTGGWEPGRTCKIYQEGKKDKTTKTGCMVVADIIRAKINK